MNHIESLFFDVLFFIAIVCALAGVDRRLTWAAFIASPAPLIATLGNQRRASIAAFIVAFIPLLPLMWLVLKERRRGIATFGVVFGLVAVIYMPLAWNSSGAWALPARAIRSQSDPNARDASSDYYRLAEDIDLKFTRDIDPWRGQGYGKVFAQVVPLPQLTTNFLDFMPHNSILWVWMRLGHFGFLAFLMMIAAVLIRGPQILRKLRDPYQVVAGTLGITCVLMLFTFAKYDLALAAPPVMFFVGSFVGMLGSMGAAREPAPETAPDGPAQPRELAAAEGAA